MQELEIFLKDLSKQYGKGFTTTTLTEWLKTNDRLKNRHEEYFIVKIDNEIKEMSREEFNQVNDINTLKLQNLIEKYETLNIHKDIKAILLEEHIKQINKVEIIGVSKWGNKYQMVQATVHGINLDNPENSTPFERPVTRVGDHCYIGLKAVHKGQVHIFRPFQVRQGAVYLDCHRGFADERSEGNKKKQDELVMANINKVLKEEVGQNLIKVNEIKFIGKIICETAFVTSITPCFSVEIDYDTFKNNQNLIEKSIDMEQFRHEGSLPRNMILDMTKKEHEKYLRNSKILKDSSCDWIYSRIFAEK